jgi:hypothetical protein
MRELDWMTTVATCTAIHPSIHHPISNDRYLLPSVPVQYCSVNAMRRSRTPHSTTRSRAAQWFVYLAVASVVVLVVINFTYTVTNAPHPVTSIPVNNVNALQRAPPVPLKPLEPLHDSVSVVDLLDPQISELQWRDTWPNQPPLPDTHQALPQVHARMEQPPPLLPPPIQQQVVSATPKQPQAQPVDVPKTVIAPTTTTTTTTPPKAASPSKLPIAVVGGMSKLPPTTLTFNIPEPEAAVPEEEPNGLGTLPYPKHIGMSVCVYVCVWSTQYGRC